jgi:8-oxo-dGTP pyrophosphatase MutT (NUDIX family)
MNFEPKNFFIGIMDLFSILLPGALLTFLIGNKAWVCLFGCQHPIPKGNAGWIVFVFASYLLGHLVFLVSAWLDEFYDWTRNATLDKQIRQLAWHDRLMPWWKRLPLWLVFKRERNIAVDRAGRIKRHYLGKIGCSSAVNNFQWSKARLAIDHPESLVTVQRFEADSKFFRSLTVVLLFLIFWYSAQQRFWVAVGSGLISLLAFWRYMEQRHKATNQAYWSVITLEGAKGQVVMTSRELKPTEPTHAGGIVYKEEDHTLKFLLVEARRRPDEWVLPKGHIELDEDPRETAVREVREETGVWARIVKCVERLEEFEIGGKQVRVQFYVMQAVSERRPEDRWRHHEWLPLEEARNRATYGKDLLSLAAEIAKGSSAMPQDGSGN